jgi:hypothetical protein
MPGTEIFLVWTMAGKWADPELSEEAHRSQLDAAAWCNEHRKLLQGDPISWKESEGASPRTWWGTSTRCKLEAGRTGKPTETITVTMFYTIEPANLAD